MNKTQQTDKNNHINNQEVLEKEIDLIQSCINRMAKNSFTVKGWLITIVTVVLALLPEKIDMKFLCVVLLIAIICFWYLDAFFLKTEKLYRWKYDWVISNRLKNSKYKYDLNPYNKNMWLLYNNKEKKAPCIIKIMFSKTLLPMYGFMSLAVVFLLFNTHFEWINIVIQETIPQ